MGHIYGLNEAQQKYAATASNLAKEVLSKYAADVDKSGRYPRESMEAIARAGLYGLCLPTTVGGQGQPPRVFAAVAEELAQGCASSAMVYVMHVTAAQQIAASATLKNKDALLKEICAGKHLTTLAFSERGSRSQFWAPVSKMSENGGNLTTSAFKSWVTTAGNADSYVSSAQKPGAASPMESTLYLVRKGARGLKIAGSFDGLGLRGNDSAPVELVNVAVPRDDLLTGQGDGAGGMLTVVLPWFVVGTAAMANGLCLAAVNATQGHLVGAGFDHTGTKLRDLPNLRARLTEMNVRAQQSRALLGYTVGEMEKPNDFTPLWVLQSRLAALEAATEVTDLAMKACGGAAFSKQLPIERLFRDARAGWVMAPTVDHLKEFTGRALTGLPLF
ncbi:MAG: acyl-CoA/acyl-ACP dehydrogenase [Planctomycetes bacterium]|nr:acyl-CoA/acyl-ACP dehydrogenase [Planctomycetota bacterium]